MSRLDLDDAIKLIEDNRSRGHFSGEKPEDLILKAEEALGVKLPPSYRLFISKYGCGNICSLEIYGIIKDDFENGTVPNGIWATLNQRKLSNLPQELILITDTGDGGYYALNAYNKSSGEEYPVVEWMPGADNPDLAELPISYNDFGEFLLGKVRWAINVC